MSDKSYKLYYENRPIKILFLLSDTDSLYKLSNAVEYNTTLWGWRFNQIIVLKKVKGVVVFDDLSRKQIKALDPDIIITSFKIKEKFKKEIYSFISPLFIEKSDYSRPYFITSYHTKPIPLYPYVNNLNIFNEFLKQPPLINLSYNNSKNKALHSFIKINFGNYDESLFYMKEIKDSNRLKTYDICNYKALDSFINEFISDYSTKIFPIQVSAQPDYKSNNSLNVHSDAFIVYLWDTIKEASLSWNRPCFLSSWRQKTINQLFISSSVFKNSKNIIKFINKLSNPYWSNQPKVIFFSNTYNKVELEELVNKKISETIWGTLYFEVIESLPDNDFVFYNWYSKDNLKHITLSKNEDKLLLKKPEVYQFNQWNAWYMTDIYIEYYPDKFEYTNIIYWWQFPLKNYISQEITKGKKSRVLFNRNLSCLMDMSENSSSWFHWVNHNSEFANLNLKLPKNDNLFFRDILMLNDNIHTSYKTNFPDLRLSDSWRKLLSTISLFWSLFESKWYLENKAWNNVFHNMSNWKEEVILKDFPVKIKKTLSLNDLEGVNSLNYDETIEKITTIVKKEIAWLHLSKKEWLCFKDIILPHYSSYMKDDELEIRIKSELHRFCSNNVFSIWIKPRCDRCKNQNWLSINNINLKLTCDYCGNEFILGPEQEWYYKLNDLVKQLYEQSWLYPVILALAQLQEESRNSFIYCWSLDIFKDERNILTDLDIACIKDWLLIIWEVKEKSNLFKQSNFDDYFEISKIINPDLVIFTSLDRQSVFVKTQIGILNKKFKELWLLTKAEWYSIREI